MLSLIRMIDPVIFEWGPIAVRWYGLMYVLGYAAAIFLMRREIRAGRLPLTVQLLDSLIFYIIVGMFIGARTFYVFIYNWDHYSENMSEILQFWRGGLSFHGALVGIMISTYIFCRQNKKSFFQISDHMALVVPVGLFLGRIGNFINGELYGRVTTSPLGVVFPGAGPLPRHPSQLYQGVSEGLLMFAVLRFLRWKEVSSGKSRPHGTYGAIFIIGYGIIRFCVEFLREPDEQLGFFLGWITMGQILCLLMVLGGFFLLVRARKAGSLLPKN